MTSSKKKYKVVLIGAGRVGFHLGHRMHEVGIEVIQIFSRTKSKAKILAESINAEGVNKLEKIDPDADLYLLAVNDDAIQQVSKKLSKILPKRSFLAHTSGATNSTVFKKYFENYGTLYPLQTFSLEKNPAFEKIPICIHSNSENGLEFLSKIANLVSPKVFFINDDQRKRLHVAAVFVNNFVNHLFFLGKKILDEDNISLDILKPLINETVKKIMENDPKEMQTGPAIRGDIKTIESHLELLEEHPEIQSIYSIITNNIQKNHS